MRAAHDNFDAVLAAHTLQEAAAILRVKPSWLERQAAARRIPFAMLGGSYRFTSGHLAAMVQLHECVPAMAAWDRGTDTRPQRSHQPPEPLMPTPLRPRPRTGPRRAA